MAEHISKIDKLQHTQSEQEQHTTYIKTIISQRLVLSLIQKDNGQGNHTSVLDRDTVGNSSESQPFLTGTKE